MKILIIGAGAVGIGLAASVKSQGADVSIYAKGETAKAIKENGIARCGLFAHYSFDSSEITVYEDYKNIGNALFDYIFINVILILEY